MIQDRSLLAGMVGTAFDGSTLGNHTRSPGLARSMAVRACLLLLLAVLTLVLDGVINKGTPITSNLWWETAVNLVHGRGYSSCDEYYFPSCGPTNQVTAAREPVPVLLFSAVALLFNDSMLAGAGLQLLINIGVLVATVALARQLAGPGTALMAGALWALYLPAYDVHRYLAGDLIAALFQTCAFTVAVRAARAGSPGGWIGAGLLFGLSALSRSAALVTVLPFAALLIIRAAKHMGRRASGQPPLRSAALLLAALAVCISPWAARNYWVFGRPIVGTTLAEYNLYRGNAVLDGPHYLRFSASKEIHDETVSLMARANLPPDANEAQLDDVYREAAVDVIRRHPGRYLALSAHRFGMLWFDWTVNEAYGAAGNLTWATQNAVLLLLGLWGTILVWRKHWPLPLAVIAFCLAYMLVLSRERYVISIVPVVVVLSAVALSDIWRRLGFRPLPLVAGR